MAVDNSNSTNTASIAATDASAARLAISGLAAGATNLLQNVAGQIFNIDFTSNAGVAYSAEEWRVRVSMSTPLAGEFYSRNVGLTPLKSTYNGVVFPYTPQITVAHNARYGAAQLTHANYASYFYEGSEVQAITISGDFTVQNTAEGQYLMAAIQFFRAATKMFYGNDVLAGAPPPLVFLDGYGDNYFPHVPCIVTNFTHTLPSDVDYVKVPTLSVENPAGSQYSTLTRLPTMSQLSVTLQPVYSRNTVAKYSGLSATGTFGTVNGYTRGLI
jgi:hypothetical protein